LLDRIRALGRLTPSESRIAAYLDQAFPLTALETVTSISRHADVGRATVVRFVSRLGYRGFADFQHCLKHELLSRLRLPAERYLLRKSRRLGRAHDGLRNHVAQVVHNLNEAVERIPPARLLAAARLLSECRGSVYVTGSRTSFGLAFMFSLHLTYLRNGVVLLDNLGGRLPTMLREVSRRDVAFIIFRSRYSAVTEKVAQWCAAHGCRIILLTDREANPLSRIAHLQFVTPAEGTSIFESGCAILALMETLINLVAADYEGELDRRTTTVEEAFSAFDTFLEGGLSAKRPLSLNPRTRSRAAASGGGS
jgi:DNA-binding MurR/RpiR family transcriptional regulator